MVYESVAIVVVLLGCTAFLARLIGHLAALIQNGLTTLDQNVAQAIQTTVSNLPIGDFEPVNPIQAAIAQFLMNKVQSDSIQMPERAENGQFTVLEQNQS
tara:strand:+ start:603 stop:902 length:300 start_codon:yes stop_codon:yes gene_type:complete